MVNSQTRSTERGGKGVKVLQLEMGDGGGGEVVPVANQFSGSKTNCVDVLRTIPWMHQVLPLHNIVVSDLGKI